MMGAVGVEGSKERRGQQSMLCVTLQHQHCAAAGQQFQHNKSDGDVLTWWCCAVFLLCLCCLLLGCPLPQVWAIWC